MDRNELARMRMVGAHEREGMRMAGVPIECPRCKCVWGTTFAQADRVDCKGARVGKPGKIRSCAECGTFYLLRDDGSVIQCGTKGKAGYPLSPNSVSPMIPTNGIPGSGKPAELSGDATGGVRNGSGVAFDGDMVLFD